MATIPGGLRAQVPMEELTSPYKTHSCADTVTAESLVAESELAFTGKILKQDKGLTWFRIYALHHGDYKGRIVMVAGFPGGRNFVPGNGQSYDLGGIYTVALRSPRDRKEKMIGADYINAVDDCGASILAKAHDRYGLYRMTPEQMKPGLLEAPRNFLYFHKGVVFLLLLAGAGAAGFKYRTILQNMKKHGAQKRA